MTLVEQYKITNLMLNLAPIVYNQYSFMGLIGNKLLLY